MNLEQIVEEALEGEIKSEAYKAGAMYELRSLLISHKPKKGTEARDAFDSGCELGRQLFDKVKPRY